MSLIGSREAGIEVIPSGVPPKVVLTRSERRDKVDVEGGRASDIEDLHLTLNDGTPNAFDVRIDVLLHAAMVSPAAEQWSTYPNRRSCPASNAR